MKTHRSAYRLHAAGSSCLAWLLLVTVGPSAALGLHGPAPPALGGSEDASPFGDATRVLLRFEEESGLAVGGSWDPAVAGELGATDVEVRDLGFGATLHTFRWKGDLFRAVAEVLDFYDAVAEYRLTVLSGSSWALEVDDVKRGIAEGFPDPAGASKPAVDFDPGTALVAEVQREVLRHQNFPATEAALRAALADALGPRPPVRVPPRLRQDHARLTSPFGRYRAGTLCGFAGTAPYAKRVVDEWVRLRRPDVLEDLLRGPNPEGRVMAVVGLRELERSGTRLSETTRKGIEAVLELPVSLRVCHGCTLTTATSARDVVGEYQPE